MWQLPTWEDISCVTVVKTGYSVRRLTPCPSLSSRLYLSLSLDLLFLLWLLKDNVDHCSISMMVGIRRSLKTCFLTRLSFRSEVEQGSAFGVLSLLLACHACRENTLP